MHVVLGVVAKRTLGGTPEDRAGAVSRALSMAERFIGAALPTRGGVLAEYRWVSPEGSSAMALWSNEGQVRLSRMVAGRPNTSLGIVGYTDRSLRAERLLDVDDLLAESTRLPGCFGLMRAFEGRVEAVTDSTRSNNLFVSETEQLRIVSSRATLSALIASSVDQGRSNPVVARDFIGLRHMAAIGYYLGSRTPFEGVSAVAPSTETILTADQVRSRRLSQDVQFDLSASSWRDAVVDTARSLVRAFDVIPPGDVNLSLTGGRDSRILASGLVHRPELRVSTGTSGRPDHPDVVIARQIASVLGVPHTTRPPGGVVSENEVWAEDPFSRIIRNLDIHDGMTSGWDDFADYPDYVEAYSMSGVGGEILRGGLVWPEVTELTSEIVTTRLSTMFGGGNFLSRELRAASLEEGAEIIEEAKRDPYSAADEFYRVHRNGRWVSARRSGARIGREIIDPLLDNRLIQAVRTIRPEERWRERLVFDVIAHLTPELRDIPLDAVRWRFERDAPMAGTSADEMAGWHLRHPIVHEPATDRYHWQKLSDRRVRGRILEVILDGLSGPAGALFERAELEKYLARDPFPAPAVVWHIATAVVAMNTPWYWTVRPALVRPIRTSG